MTIRLRITLAIAILCAGTLGCSTGGGIPASSAGIAPAGHSTARGATEHVTITQFEDLPRGYSYGPAAIASGPEKSLWVTVCSGVVGHECAIVQVATSGKALHTFYYADKALDSFSGIAVAPDNTLWITDTSDALGAEILRMTTRGVYTTFTLHERQRLFQIALGSDGALWFTQTGNGTHSEIVRITTKGAITRYLVPGSAAGIASGPDKALWFTEPDSPDFTSPMIGRLTTTGKLTLFSKGLRSGAGPTSIAAGPDGALWFTELRNARPGAIGRITTAGKVTEYKVGISRHETLNAIAAGPDGAMWFTEYALRNGSVASSKLGRITMGGEITEYSRGLPQDSGPEGLAAGPDGNMWFAESLTDLTGRATLLDPR